MGERAGGWVGRLGGGWWGCMEWGVVFVLFVILMVYALKVSVAAQGLCLYDILHC